VPCFRILPGYLHQDVRAHSRIRSHQLRSAGLNHRVPATQKQPGSVRHSLTTVATATTHTPLCDDRSYWNPAVLFQDQVGYEHEPPAELERRNWMVDRLIFYHWMIGDRVNLLTATPADLTPEVRAEVRKSLTTQATDDLENLLLFLFGQAEQVT